MLDAILNDLEFAVFDYQTLKDTAKLIGCPVKEKAFELKDWDAFRDLYNQVQDEEYKYNDNFIEGFVFVDSKGFMTKLKSQYYSFWKHMRSLSQGVLRSGVYTKMSSLVSPISNLFYGFCKELYAKDYNRDTKSYPYKIDIISLRDKFYSSLEQSAKFNDINKKML